MPLPVRCPKCGKQADVSRAAVGLAARCSDCQTVFPVPVGSGQLLVEWGVPLVGKRVPLTPPGPVTIGRADDNTLVLSGNNVSRHHSMLVWEDETWSAVDLGSGNGTFVDGRKVQRGTLENNSGLAIGDYVIRVTIVTSAGSSLEHLAIPGDTDQHAVAQAPAPPASLVAGPAPPIRPDAKERTAVGNPALAARGRGTTLRAPEVPSYSDAAPGRPISPRWERIMWGWAIVAAVVLAAIVVYLMAIR